MIDVHGDLYVHMKWYLARWCLEQPEIAHRVVLIDPLDPN